MIWRRTSELLTLEAQLKPDTGRPGPLPSPHTLFSRFALGQADPAPCGRTALNRPQGPPFCVLTASTTSTLPAHLGSDTWELRFNQPQRDRLYKQKDWNPGKWLFFVSFFSIEKQLSSRYGLFCSPGRPCSSDACLAGAPAGPWSRVGRSLRCSQLPCENVNGRMDWPRSCCQVCVSHRAALRDGVKSLSKLRSLRFYVQSSRKERAGPAVPSAEAQGFLSVAAAHSPEEKAPIFAPPRWRGSYPHSH